MYIIGVMHMARLKQHMYQHLRSAKEWLTKAEEAFDKQHDIRAELDLMLAQAELQHAKEANRSRQWRYKYVVFRHGMALLLALFVVMGGGGLYWWATRPIPTVPAPEPLTAQIHSPVEATPKVEETTPVTTTTAVPSKKEVPLQQAVTEQETPKPSKIIPASQPEPVTYQAPVVVSENEMQKLVRAAGKSLRGQ